MLFNFEFDVTVFDVPVFDITLLYPQNNLITLTTADAKGGLQPGLPGPKKSKKPSLGY